MVSITSWTWCGRTPEAVQHLLGVGQAHINGVGGWIKLEGNKMVCTSKVLVMFQTKLIFQTKMS